MSDPLDTLFDEQPQGIEAEPDAAPEPVEAEPTAAAPDAEPAPEPGKGEPAAPPAASEEKHQSIPISALLDEREKRQAAERRAQEIERRLAEIEAAKKPAPDFYDDPQGALQRQQEQFQRMLMQDRVQRSYVMAEKEHGAEFVRQVVDFFNDPKHAPKSHEFLNSPFPLDEAIRYYRQQQALAEIGEDPAAYRERLRQELLAELQAQQPAPVQPAKPASPPRSMASMPSTGPASAPVRGFDALFPD